MKLAIFLSLKGSRSLYNCLAAFVLVAKIACQLLHVRLPACISAAPTGRISVKFDIRYVYENLLRNFRFG
jgi:hypothetical protein